MYLCLFLTRSIHPPQVSLSAFMKIVSNGSIHSYCRWVDYMLRYRLGFKMKLLMSYVITIVGVTMVVRVGRQECNHIFDRVSLFCKLMPHS